MSTLGETDELLHVAELAARAGGDALTDWRGRFTTREKSAADLVTDADEAAQQAIAGVISDHFPDHAFLGEEGPGAIAELLDATVCWVVDPLDGTTNYVHGLPMYSVSVAAVVEGEITVGVVLDPVRDRTYSAARGGGAQCNGQPLRVSDTRQLSQALVALSLPPLVDRHAPDLLDFNDVVGRCQAIRRLGSAALNLAYVAEGLLDAFWARQIHAWDIAAGVLLVEEAGGFASGCDGNRLDLQNAHVLAAGHRDLHAELLAALAQSGKNPGAR